MFINRLWRHCQEGGSDEEFISYLNQNKSCYSTVYTETKALYIS